MKGHSCGSFLPLWRQLQAAQGASLSWLFLKSPEFALSLGPERVPPILLLISFGVSETHHKTVCHSWFFSFMEMTPPLFQAVTEASLVTILPLNTSFMITNTD